MFKVQRYKKPEFLELSSHKVQTLEQLMSPVYVGPNGPRQNWRMSMIGGLRWRNGLSRKIWNKPSRYTWAGVPSLKSQLCKIIGVYPWEFNTLQDVYDHIDQLEAANKQ